MRYNPAAVEQYYDTLGRGEWERLARSPVEEIKFHIHAYYLRQFVTRGARVLEIGAGPGRFTEVLHQLGCRIVVGDLSTVQLDLNRQFAADRGFAASVEHWCKLNICDLSVIASETFDVVVAYGGPLSYMFEQQDRAVQECRRVVKSEGLLLASVMSLWGTLHRLLPGVLMFPVEHSRDIIHSGDLTPENDPTSTHHCHLFRAHEFKECLQRNGFQCVVMSASNTLSTNHEEALRTVRTEPERWSALLEFEIEASATEGYVDGGTHLIAVARRCA